MDNQTDPSVATTTPRRHAPDASQRDVRAWAMLCHMAALAWFIIPPIGHLLGPFTIWLLKRQEYPSVNEHGKAAINFQISLTLYSIPPIILLVTVHFARIAILALLTLIVLFFVGIIRATIQANRDEITRYPFSIRLIK